MSREKNIDEAVMALLDERGAWSYKNYSAQHNPAGVPDIIACYNGVPLFIEDKRAQGFSSDVSFLQKKHINHITEQGGVGVIAKSAAFVEKVLDAIDSDTREDDLKALGWKSHGRDEIRNNSWNEETIW